MNPNPTCAPRWRRSLECFGSRSCGENVGEIVTSILNGVFGFLKSSVRLRPVPMRKVRTGCRSGPIAGCLSEPITMAPTRIVTVALIFAGPPPTRLTLIFAKPGPSAAASKRL